MTAAAEDDAQQHPEDANENCRPVAQPPLLASLPYPYLARHTTRHHWGSYILKGRVQRPGPLLRDLLTGRRPLDRGTDVRPRSPRWIDGGVG